MRPSRKPRNAAQPKVSAPVTLDTPAQKLAFIEHLQATTDPEMFNLTMSLGRALAAGVDIGPMIAKTERDVIAKGCRRSCQRLNRRIDARN